ncbi:MAG TPA: glycosyltransferase family 4 protein [Chitinophagales bacterium]|nr:glycosyltransferase family 4 protein [Chitinophagales bacterium]HPH88681.1 glycosyltransferase family 4 protein [Chitinophagales bacterium]
MSKKNILFLSPYPFGKAPSQRLKFEQYYPHFEANGYSINTSSFIDEKFWETIYKPGHLVSKITGTLRGYLRRLTDLFFIRNYDVVYVHLWVTPFGPPIFEWLVSKMAKKIIYDIDDMIYLNNSSKRFIDKVKGRNKPLALMKNAHHVIVCSPFLEKFVRNYNKNVTTILATYNTDVSKIKNHQPKETTTIGWTGTHSTLKYLSIVADVLARISTEKSINFLVICNAPYVYEGINVKNITWTSENELIDLEKIDIGLYPLEKEEWVLGKSGNKALAYMNLGIPCVATNYGTNAIVIQHHENGFLADTPDDWYKYITYLIEKPDERNRLGINARKTVVEKYSVEANKNTYLAIIRNLVN